MSKKEKNPAEIQLLRLKAEEKLKERQKKGNVPISEFDSKNLLHELQVHQIVLEMLNEELKEANETAEMALRKYTMLYDFAPIGYFTLEKDGSIIELNFTGADMLGERRFTLVNQNFKLFIAKDSKDVFNRFFNKIYTSNIKESCELMLEYDNNPLCHVYLEGITTDDDQKCLLSVIDIARFKMLNN